MWSSQNNNKDSIPEKISIIERYRNQIYFFFNIFNIFSISKIFPKSFPSLRRFHLPILSSWRATGCRTTDPVGGDRYPVPFATAFPAVSGWTLSAPVSADRVGITIACPLVGSDVFVFGFGFGLFSWPLSLRVGCVSCFVFFSTVVCNCVCDHLVGMGTTTRYRLYKVANKIQTSLGIKSVRNRRTLQLPFTYVRAYGTASTYTSV